MSTKAFFLSVISDSEQQWKKQQKVSVCAVGDVDVALNFKSIPNSTCKAKAPPTGSGDQTYSHRTILCDFLPISMMPYNFQFNFQEFWSLKTITISNIILNKYPGFKSTNNYEHMNKSYHQRKLNFQIAH